MKKLLATLILTTGLAVHAENGQNDHTAEVCSERNTNLCLHLGFSKHPNSSDESRFMVHFLPKADVLTEQISNVKVDLWMDMGSGHGHGSAPVDLKRLDPSHYIVTNAWFVMSGKWQVRVSFEFAGQQYLLITPIEINH